MSADDKKPIDLKEYFSPENQFLYVRRADLQQILSYFADKGTLAGAFEAMEEDIAAAIRKEVQAEMGQFMLSMRQAEEADDGRIITLG